MGREWQKRKRFGGEKNKWLKIQEHDSRRKENVTENSEVGLGNVVRKREM